MGNELPRLVDNSEILRGQIFNVAVLSTKGRPLNFLEKINEDSYKIISREDGLEGRINFITGKKEAEILKIVTEVKLRPALIIQPDSDNRKSTYPFVVILPLANIPQNKKDTSIMKRLVDKNDLDVMHYLGHNSYVTVNDPSRVYKNMIFAFEDGIKKSVDTGTIEIIMKKFANCFEIDKLQKCDECIYNYEKYTGVIELEETIGQVASMVRKDIVNK